MHGTLHLDDRRRPLDQTAPTWPALLADLACVLGGGALVAAGAACGLGSRLLARAQARLDDAGLALAEPPSHAYGGAVAPVSLVEGSVSVRLSDGEYRR